MTSENVEKNKKAVHLRLVLTYLFKNLFNTKKHLAWVLKKNFIYFSVYPKQSQIKQSTFFADHHNESEMYKQYRVLVQ